MKEPKLDGPEVDPLLSDDDVTSDGEDDEDVDVEEGWAISMDVEDKCRLLS